MNQSNYSLIIYLLSLLILMQFISCKTVAPSKESIPETELRGSLENIIPVTVFTNPSGSWFKLTNDSKIFIAPMDHETLFIGSYLQEKIKSKTGYELVTLADVGQQSDGNIYLILDKSDPSLGVEEYELIISEELVILRANNTEGLFRGIQTLSQIFQPIKINSTTQSGSFYIPTGTIKDYPRFPWRGVMLDVVRHFFSVGDVKKLIDKIAYYKINRLHLHLTDDQGWRIQINSWPNLALYGGSTQVGGGYGGYYTQDEYSEIIEYAKKRYIVVIPEIDMPGHTNAALASYPVLNCDGIAPPLYTGIKVGFSSLCLSKDSTYIFVDDVIREISHLTPGPYIHIGGDEAMATDSIEYIHFIKKVQDIVQSYGKQMIGWEEIAQSKLNSTTVVHHWRKPQLALEGVRQGSKLIMSPSTKAYMDMKYTPSTELGLNWAAYIEVSDAYNWDPITQIEGLHVSDVLGVEAPLWTETILTYSDIEYMLFPRLPGIAEIGWSPAENRNWDAYKKRLANHGAYWKAIGVNFYPSPEINWE